MAFHHTQMDHKSNITSGKGGGVLEIHKDGKEKWIMVM